MHSIQAWGIRGEKCIQMGWVRWCASRHAYPTYIIQCCDDNSSENACIDAWSIMHIFWGIVFSIPIFFIQPVYSFFLTLALAILFEVFENSDIGRRVSAWICCSELYDGDNFWNSVFDVMFDLVGWCIMYVISLNVSS